MLVLSSDYARETVRGTHRKFWGLLADYSFEITFTYQQESGQWVGICTELGTSAFADTLEQTRFELREAVSLQLNEIEQIDDGREYLVDNDVSIVPTKLSQFPKLLNPNLSPQARFVIL